MPDDPANSPWRALDEHLAIMQRARQWKRHDDQIAKRIEVSPDIYDILHSMAPPDHVLLLGYAALPRSIQTTVPVFVHYDWPEGVVGVTYLDDHVESFQY